MYFLITVPLLMETLMLFITRVSLSSKRISIWASFPRLFFQVILLNLLTPLPVPVSTANLNYTTQTGQRNPQSSRWEMWKIFGNVHQALLVVITTESHVLDQTFLPNRKCTSSFADLSAGMPKNPGKSEVRHQEDTRSGLLTRFLTALETQVPPKRAFCATHTWQWTSRQSRTLSPLVFMWPTTIVQTPFPVKHSLLTASPPVSF